MKYPWMPLFWGDFLANTMHLSAQEAGAYLFLIAHAWEHDGEIPGERVRLARIAHVRPDQWNKVWNALECFFEIKANGQAIGRTYDDPPIGRTYVHMRVLDELHRLGKISSKRKAAAEQKQRKSSANGVESTSTSNRESSLGKEGKQDFRDKGADYRAPSSPYKSDNVLQPLLTKAGGR